MRAFRDLCTLGRITYSCSDEGMLEEDIAKEGLGLNKFTEDVYT
jgi:hypothetical protein